MHTVYLFAAVETPALTWACHRQHSQGEVCDLAPIEGIALVVPDHTECHTDCGVQNR